MSSASKPTLKVDWCTHEAAKYAVENWHYSKRLPMPPLVKIGAWEDGKYIGCVLFSRGANQNIGAPYGLAQTECCELVRVALRNHATPVTRIVAIALRFLRKNAPGIRLAVSYADPSEGHHGGIYQGGGWVYAGESGSATKYLHDGRWKHSREVNAVSFASTGQPGSGKIRNWQSLPKKQFPGKHKYLMPLDDAMRAQIAPLSRPYPKKITRAGSADSGTPGTQPGRDGATPISALQTHHDHGQAQGETGPQDPADA
jgi:hypothetical protein